MDVIVIQEHITEYPDPIFLKKGERVKLGQMDDEYPNWVMVTTKTGEQGWAPKQYLTPNKEETFGILHCDYDTVELNTTVGEKLSVQFELNSWFRVTRENGQIGWVPVESVTRA